MKKPKIEVQDVNHVMVDGENYGAVADAIANNPQLAPAIQAALIAWENAADTHSERSEKQMGTAFEAARKEIEAHAEEGRKKAEAAVEAARAESAAHRAAAMEAGAKAADIERFMHGVAEKIEAALAEPGIEHPTEFLAGIAIALKTPVIERRIAELEAHHATVGKMIAGLKAQIEPPEGTGQPGEATEESAHGA